ncbi:MAG: ROK family protein, partial [Candidatus Cloacimonetes bacterium]|nr:ROK family protein [Candidatus Cloacimonadota bacterium]
VDVDRGMITGITPNLPNIQNIAFKKEIEKNNNIKVYLENDANLMSYAEASLYPSQSVLGITIGTGIGSGFIYQNDIFRGQNYSAIELGHTIVNLGGRRCKCGKFGCVEAYSSANSMLAICREEFPNLEINNIAHLLKIGKENKEIKSKINLLNSYLAMTIANAVSTLDPQVVCIGGGVVEIKDFDFDFLKQKIKGFLASNYQCVKIVKAQFENRAGIYGGILIAESKYLEHNLLYK